MNQRKARPKMTGQWTIAFIVLAVLSMAFPKELVDFSGYFLGATLHLLTGW